MLDPYELDYSKNTPGLIFGLKKRQAQKLVLGIIFVILLVMPMLVYVAFTSFFGEKARAGGLPESFNLTSSTPASINNTINP